MLVSILKLALFAGVSFIICVPMNEKTRFKRWTDIENAVFTFDCASRAIGFYADVEHNCQIFHMCDETGKRIPHVCANDTSFNQEYRICDWEYNFNCSEAPKWFYLNELTYATDPPINEEDYDIYDKDKN